MPEGKAEYTYFRKGHGKRRTGTDDYEVDNYPGLPGIGGYDLGLKLREHADRLGA